MSPSSCLSRSEALRSAALIRRSTAASRATSTPERFAAAFAEDVAHFARACRDQAAPKVRRGDAVLATLIAEAALRSARCGRPVALTNPTGSGDPADRILVEG